MRNIRQNLFFALAYNGIGIPVAAGVLYPFLGIRLSPIIAAAAMALSSLSVVSNANRLRRYRPAPLPEASTANVEPLVQVGDAYDAAGSAQDSGGQGHGAPRDDGPPYGTTVADPVCGMLVDRAAAAGCRSTGSGTVYFCSAGCAASFDAEPRRFAAARTASE